MCGISGYFSANDFQLNCIHKMIEAQHHRGPDFNDYWTNNKNLVMGHNRLSIQDLSKKANQPMISEKRNVIVFNGEIYNHKIIRNLYLNNINFQSSGDTQTLLRLIEKKGIDFTLKKIDGMFAFCYYDIEKNLLYLARDNFGEKPLYYGFENKNFVFSSELEAIKKTNIFENKINQKSINLYLKYGNIPSPHSIYENIYKLDPGSYLIFNLNSNKLEIFKYWDPLIIAKNAIGNQSSLNIKDAQSVLKDKLVKSVKSKLISDVPIGAFLSSGIDSSLIVSIMQEISSKPINTFTIGFEETNLNEAKDAKKIASFLNTNHEEYYFNENDVSKYATKMSEYYSEPFSDSSQIPTYLISKIASNKVKVCLTGDGGDELFGGYTRYIFADKINNINYSLRRKFSILDKLFINHMPNIFYNFLNILLKGHSIHITRDKLKKLFNILNQKDINAIYDNLISNFQKDEIIDILINNTYFDINSNIFLSDNSKENMMINDTLNYLPNDILTKVDRASMANSLETRLPFLDKEIFDFIWSLKIDYKINSSNGKIILKNILSDYIPNNLIKRSKKGFAVPVDNWIRNSLHDWTNDMLSKETIQKYNLFDYEQVSNILQNHLTFKENNGNKIWLLANFNSWMINNK